jgi:hypothetical protein
VALTEAVPAAARPADARKPEFDPFLQWHKAMHVRAVMRPLRMEKIRALREALPRRLKVG